MPTLVLRGIAATAKTLMLQRMLTLSGITVNSASVALPYCVTRCFRSATDLKTGTTLSDANGSYSFDIVDGLAYYIVARKCYTADALWWTADSGIVTADASYIEGTTVPTLVGI